jgi:Enoyl-CoA hydratase/isomerase
MAAPKLLVERSGPVTILTLNRPHIRNCIDAETAGLLSDSIEAFAEDDEALVITGAGDRAFCSGADLKDIEAIIDRAGGTRRAPLRFSDHEPGKPTISAVEGWCIAGGIELACWCDFTVAGRGATVRGVQPPVGRGLGRRRHAADAPADRRGARAVPPGGGGAVRRAPGDGHGPGPGGGPRRPGPGSGGAARRTDRGVPAIEPPGGSEFGRGRDGASAGGRLAREAATGRPAENDELRAGVSRFVDEREGGAAGTLHP